VTSSARICVLGSPPDKDRGGLQLALRPDLEAAVVSGGGIVTADPRTAGGLIWTSWDDPVGLSQVLADCPDIRWVHLCPAGIDLITPILDSSHTWTSAKGCYSDPIAEYVIGTVLACWRNVPAYDRARMWSPQPARSLFGAKVTVVGGGGIGEAVVRLLSAFNADVTVVRRTVRPMECANRTLTSDRLHEGVSDADRVVLALALTAESTGLVDASVLASMTADTWLVNVSRGKHIVTDDLVAALYSGRLGGAILDVTDPEPLPAGHRLWALDNCLITPHTSCTAELARPYLLPRIRENVARFLADQPLLGVVDVSAGY
jgi:phosphoglycerate dehydrogenase-like enzyme